MKSVLKDGDPQKVEMGRKCIVGKANSRGRIGSWGKHSLTGDPSSLSRQDSREGCYREMNGAALSKVTVHRKDLEMREQ